MVAVHELPLCLTCSALQLLYALWLLYAGLLSLFIHYCYGFNHVCYHICYHISTTTAVFMVIIARSMIAVAPLIAITVSAIANIVLSHM